LLTVEQTDYLFDDARYFPRDFAKDETMTSSKGSEEHLTSSGLSAPLEIRIDKWGVPHIKASSMPDLFFGQGFNAARDRLWQIDSARKRGLGLLAADFGPGYLAQDRAARLFLYRGEMDAEWACYGSDSKSICTSFVQGINAYIDLVDRHPERMPQEFIQLGTRPSKWAPEDVVRVRTHGWVRNALSEVVRANVVAKSDAFTDLLRQNLEPRVKPHVANGIDLNSIPLKVLDVYKLAITGVTFREDRLQTPIEKADVWTKVTPLGEVIADTSLQGSNNWAVSGRRTATGRPILGSDPHRIVAIPCTSDSARLRRDRRRRANLSGYHDRPQRSQCVRTYPVLRPGRGGRLRLRDQTRKSEQLSLQGRLGGYASC
jgi:penicillin amidase